MATVALAAKAPPSEVDLPPDRVLYIAPGQSLPALVRELYPDQPEQWERIEAWIVDNNPHAVAEDQPALLRDDVRVRLPQPSEFAGEQARAEDAGAGDARSPLRFGGRYLFVDPSQSLEELVPKIYPDHPERWDEIKQAIMERNQDVFASTPVDAPIGRGTRLSIPEVITATQQTKQRVAPGQPVGKVVSASGRLTATDRAGRTRVLASGNPVRRHDTVRTGRQGRAVIEMRDGERLTLRADSEVRIRAWRLPDTGPGTRVLELVTGGLRAVTGAIGNRGEDDYRTITPEATLGVRGTAYAVRLCRGDDCRADGGASAAPPAGLYVGVDQGRVSVLNQAGEAFYSAGEFGYVADRTRAPQRADADVARLVYTEDERAAIEAEREPAGEGASGEESDEGSGWAWALGGLLLLGLAL